MQLLEGTKDAHSNIPGLNTYLKESLLVFPETFGCLEILTSPAPRIPPPPVPACQGLGTSCPVGFALIPPSEVSFVGLATLCSFLGLVWSRAAVCGGFLDCTAAWLVVLHWFHLTASLFVPLGGVSGGPFLVLGFPRGWSCTGSLGLMVRSALRSSWPVAALLVLHLWLFCVREKTWSSPPHQE